MRRPVSDEFRVPTPESLAHVAIPANRPVSGQGLLKVFERNLVPLHGLAVLVNQRGRVIVPVNLAKPLVAVPILPSYQRLTMLETRPALGAS